MPHFAMITRHPPGGRPGAGTVGDLSRRVSERVSKECPGVAWTGNYAALGPNDYLHIFEAPDDGAASRVALIVRSFDGTAARA
jgi:uncharacterized protein with GYD domain